jgi:hypothetical protein
MTDGNFGHPALPFYRNRWYFVSESRIYRDFEFTYGAAIHFRGDAFSVTK